jgi:toxin ParE1/3/4
MAEPLQVNWTLNALEGLERLRSYFQEKAGQEMLPEEARRIREAVRDLARNPAGGRTGRVPGTREMVVSPYVLPYRVSEGRLEILDILNSALNWKQVL